LGDQREERNSPHALEYVAGVEEAEAKRCTRMLTTATSTRPTLRSQRVCVSAATTATVPESIQTRTSVTPWRNGRSNGSICLSQSQATLSPTTWLARGSSLTLTFATFAQCMVSAARRRSSRGFRKPPRFERLPWLALQRRAFAASSLTSNTTSTNMAGFSNNMST